MKTGTSLAIFVFALVTIGHVVRLAFNIPVTIGSWSVPTWVSLAGALIAGGLAVTLWRESRPAGAPGQP